MTLRALLVLVALIAAVGMESRVAAYAVFGPKWQTATVPFVVNVSSSQRFSESEIMTAIQTAVASWNTLGSVQLVYAGTTTSTGFVMNGTNVIWFSQNVGSGFGTGLAAQINTPSSTAPALTDIDMAIYESRYDLYVGTGCPGSTSNSLYLEDLLVHEFGHMLGLNHTTVPNATMVSAAQGWCTKERLTLEDDDIAGLAFLYPPGPPPTTTTIPPTTTTIPISPALEVKAYKQKGVQKVELLWSGLTAATVTIRRQGVVIALVPNNGRWTDTINGKGSATYEYQVCDTACTAVVSAIF